MKSIIWISVGMFVAQLSFGFVILGLRDDPAEVCRDSVVSSEYRIKGSIWNAEQMTKQSATVIRTDIAKLAKHHQVLPGVWEATVLRGDQ